MAERTPRSFAPEVMLWLGLVALLTFALPASAREMQADDKTAIAVAVERFNNAMRQKDYDTVIEASVPQAVIDQIGKAYGLAEADKEAFAAAIRTQMVATLKVVELVDFGMDVKAASYHELPDGSFYAMLPTETVMKTEDKKYRARSQTLALKDGGRWYLLRVSGAEQADMVRAAYPAFKDVQFGNGTMEEIGK